MNRTRTIAALTIGLASALGFAGTASAAPPDLETARARCLTGISERQVQLDVLLEKSTASSTLTDGHEGTIGSFISAAKNGLSGLQAEVQADADLASLRADCEAVASEYRVYALRTPQVHLALAGDRTAAGIVKGNEIAATLQTAIDAAEANGKDVAEVTALLADLNAELASASTSLSGVVDSELGYTPADWNANHSVLSSATTAVRSAHTDLKAALVDAKAIVAALRALAL
ncbi:MAG: hypothetical protein Q7V57_08080 [Actinomycetota bacterium]|nr:hypothetical protein [Actinomycetota bacterium]